MCVFDEQTNRQTTSAVTVAERRVTVAGFAEQSARLSGTSTQLLGGRYHHTAANHARHTCMQQPTPVLSRSVPIDLNTSIKR